MPFTSAGSALVIGPEVGFLPHPVRIDPSTIADPKTLKTVFLAMIFLLYGAPLMTISPSFPKPIPKNFSLVNTCCKLLLLKSLMSLNVK